MQLLEGKTLSNSILNSLPPRIAAVAARLGRTPALAVINYFENSPSAVYVKRKMAACEKLGITVKLLKPEGKEGSAGFKRLLAALGADAGCDAIMIERPLPDGFGTLETWDCVPASKDVDGMSSLNLGRLLIAKNFSEIETGGFFTPCTALAVIRLLKHYSIDPRGKNVALAGRSAVAGKPLALMLTMLDATVTLCHTKTPDLPGVFKRSDIVISAAGKPRWIKKEMLSEGAVVIDVGTNFDKNGKICGDADFEDIKSSVDAATPVPGGVGPVTLACLLEAVVKAAEFASKTEKEGIILT